MAEFKNFRPLRCYKPMDNGNGSAFQFRMAYNQKSEPVLMVEATNQDGPKPPPGSSASPFKWDKDIKIVMMFNHNECGELAAYIVNLQKSEKVAQYGMKFTHNVDRPDGDNLSSFSVRKPEPGNKWGNWGINIRRGERSSKMFLTAGEIMQLKILCESIISTYITEEVKNVKPRNQGPPDAKW